MVTLITAFLCMRFNPSTSSTGVTSVVGGALLLWCLVFNSVSAGTLINPLEGSRAPDTTFEITWTDTGSLFSIYVGSTSGAADILQLNNFTTRQVTVTGAPNDGSAMFITLWRFDGAWTNTIHTIYACDAAAGTCGVGSIGGSVNASGSGDYAAFISALRVVFTDFDQEFFNFIVGMGLTGLAIGVGGGWVYRAARR